MWPAIILAHKRIPKLNVLIIYENISISINNGINTKGHLGINIFKNSWSYIYIPYKKIENPILKDNNKNKIKWLVSIIDNGNNPQKLYINIIKYIKKYIAILKYPFNPNCSLNI